MRSENLHQILRESMQELRQAVAHLEYSYDKARILTREKDRLDEESLETWEGFVSRFGRVSDLFLKKYLRTKILIADPGFRGELIDVLNTAEKMNLISSASQWYEVRQLRNFSVHEYAGAKFTGTISRMFELAPILIQTKNAT
ncbi:MAG: hypothetical protein C5B49_03910 [Bdellovibrio sp.]|nr:MAG: hypothetical protein C5B49_03910 [Bdellovibrio sp.]